MFYHDLLNAVVRDFKDGKITKKAALVRIQDIENLAYAKVPNAEPDGDITFAAALAHAALSDRSYGSKAVFQAGLR